MDLFAVAIRLARLAFCFSSACVLRPIDWWCHVSLWELFAFEEPQIVPPGLAFCFMALGHCLDVVPAAPLPPMQERDAQHMF